jgi:hypothetical protein
MRCKRRNDHLWSLITFMKNVINDIITKCSEVANAPLENALVAVSLAAVVVDIGRHGNKWLIRG